MGQAINQFGKPGNSQIRNIQLLFVLYLKFGTSQLGFSMFNLNC